MKIIVLNGSGTSGKDTVVSMIDEYMNIRLIRGKRSAVVSNISSVDQIKEVAKQLGWDGTKDNKSRKFLSDLKDLSTEYNNGPFKYMKMSIENALRDRRFKSKILGIHLDALVFLHIREPEEIQKIKEYYGDDCETMLIKRDSVEQFANHADSNVDKYEYSIIIDNNGTLEELNEKVINVIDEIMGY